MSGLDAVAMAEAVRAGETTPGALLADARRRAQAIAPLNAITEMFDPPAASDGAFAGVPFLLKDLGAAMARHRLTNGSRYYARRVSEADDVFVARLKAAGLQIFGRTNAPELGLRPVTESVLHGAALNPWDRTRTPGGSSGGAAAAVAMGVVAAAHGNDIGGSLRIPASCCGVFGFKPSRGWMPAGPMRLATPGDMNTEGFITRSVRDNAALLDATLGADPALPGDPPPPARPWAAEVDEASAPLRIAMLTGPMWARTVHPDCVAALEDAAALLRSLGHTVEAAEPLTPEDHRAATRAFLVMLSARVRIQTLDAAGPAGRASRRPGRWV